MVRNSSPVFNKKADSSLPFFLSFGALWRFWAVYLFSKVIYKKKINNPLKKDKIKQTNKFITRMQNSILTNNSFYKIITFKTKTNTQQNIAFEMR